jgi:hypothetical protein
MSIINLVGTLLTPHYPTLFQVSPEIMVEAARREGARFEDTVGTIVMDNHECTLSGDPSCFCFKGVEGQHVVIESLAACRKHNIQGSEIVSNLYLATLDTTPLTIAE